MQNRIFMTIVVVALGIFIGLAVLKNQAKSPVLDKILDAQNRIESGLRNNGGDSELMAKYSDLEERLVRVEKLLRQAGAPLPGGPKGSVGEVQVQKFDIPVEHSTLIGNKDAAVTIVEFVDFQCPFCARFHEPMVEAAKAYPNDVNYMVKNFPLSFHPQARPAAMAAFAAGEQGKYAEMADLILVNGKDLSQKKYEELAGELGLDVTKFKNDMENKKDQWIGYINKDLALGGKVGVRGTPTFYINGRKTNARDLASFKTEIDAILKSKK